MRRSLAILLLLAAVCAGSAAAPAAAQDRASPSSGGGAPTELWDEFPLEQQAPKSARGGSSQASERPTQADDESASTLPLLLGAAAGLVVLALLVGVGVSRRRSRMRAERRARIRARRVGSPEPPAAALEPARPAPATARAAAPAAAAASAATTASAGNGGQAPATPRDERPARATAARPGSRPRAQPLRAFGYASISASNGQTGDELKLQVRLIQEACQQRGLTLVKVVRDVESHASSDLRRPGLTYALDRLAAREASCLVVTSIERLTRTAAHLGTMLGWLDECDARLVVIDLDLDTGTHEGRLGAKALATVGGLERKKVEERTRKGLEAARHMRRSGRPAVSDRPSLERRISEMRAQGMTLQGIADTLNAEGVPTLRGGAEWRPSSVQAAAGYKRPSRKDRPKVRHGETRDKSS
jgi:DNA invertase Pin-like site-specific DNA recombinase